MITNNGDTGSSSPPSPQSSCNSSYGSSSGRKLMNTSGSSISALVPGGVVTTQNISTVIKPKSSNNSLQFVKIQTPELSKKAVEQIRIAEETKISKEKIKEVEEEWQNNLLNWKSKRRQHFVHTVEREPSEPFNDNGDPNGGRKIKTFAEMIEQRAKSGNRLGFHLQRYIGSADDEEEAVLSESEAKELFASDENKNHVVDSKHQTNDSDCENYSSTSSSHQLDSNSPTIPEKPFRGNNDDVDASRSFTSSRQSALNCDNSSIGSPRQIEPENKHSISLVTSTESDQLNSTLKCGVIPPPIDVKNIPLTQIDEKTSQVLTKAADGRNGSYFEDDDEEGEEEEEHEEEEEEQKQQQRIAFEAKLKAFERLTKPAASNFVPPPPVPTNRVAKLSVNEARRPSLDLTAKDPRRQNVLHMRGSTFDECSNPVTPPVRREPIRSPSAANAVPPPDFKRNVLSEASILARDSDRNPPEFQHHLPQRKSVPRNVSIEGAEAVAGSVPLTKTSSQMMNPLRRLASPETRVTDDHELASGISNIDLNRNQSNPSLPMIPRTSELVMTRTNLSYSHMSPQPPHPQQADPVKKRPPTKTISSPPVNRDLYQKSTSYKELPAPIDPLNMSREPRMPPPSQISTNQLGFSQNNLIPKQRNLPPSSQVLNELPKSSSITSQKKLSPLQKDEKERPPPLQVSGKKRCSSCKEELGRGAAAFVVESLSLVYHTNCFRCSVCHVNLSNGFRGVDVRVHAGALHCQNCYSKDGLNYSRV